MKQGSVLLKNENNALPLKKTERKVTLLGKGSKNMFMRSGAGGAAPNPNLVVTLDKAFENNGFKINKEVFKAYKKLSQSNMTSPSTNVENFSEVNTDELKATFADYGDAAIITFVRIGTENTDPSDGQLDLKNDEKNLLKLAKEYKDNGTFKKIIVLINSPLPMSMDWVDSDEYGIDALVYVGVPGYYGAGGIAHLLAGEKPHLAYDENAEKLMPQLDGAGNPIMEVVNPSGHLPDTFAASAGSSAAYVNFGDRNVVVYKEGVYVGYKYYETRYEDAVLNQGNATSAKGASFGATSWDYGNEMGYPFGYGMSYTQFEQRITDLKYNATDDTIEATVMVKNNGDMNGKASVQLYAQQPYTDFDKQNGLGRPAIAYFLEGGDYYFAVGNGAHEALNNIISVKDSSANLVDHLGNAYSGNANAVKKLTIAEDATTYAKSHYDADTQVTNQFDDADYNWFVGEKNHNEDKTGGFRYLSREDWDGTWPTKTTSNPAPSDQQNMANYYKKADIQTSYTEGDGVEYNVPYKVMK